MDGIRHPWANGKPVSGFGHVHESRSKQLVFEAKDFLAARETGAPAFDLEAGQKLRNGKRAEVGGRIIAVNNARSLVYLQQSSRVERAAGNLVSARADDGARVFWDVVPNSAGTGSNGVVGRRSTEGGLEGAGREVMEQRSSGAYKERVKNVEHVFLRHVGLFEGAGVLKGVLERVEMDEEEAKAEVSKNEAKKVVVLEEKHKIGRYCEKLVLRLRLVKLEVRHRMEGGELV